jgi:hypothetical protein
MEQTVLNNTHLSMNDPEQRKKIAISRELWKRVGGWPKQKIAPETGMKVHHTLFHASDA